MPKLHRAPGRLRYVCAFVLVLGLTGCTIRLVGSYDPTLDEGLTKYYQAMDMFLSQMERYV
jgi:hypothetical protein